METLILVSTPMAQAWAQIFHMKQTEHFLNADREMIMSKLGMLSLFIHLKYFYDIMALNTGYLELAL